MSVKLNSKYKVTVISQENEGLGVCKIDDMITFVGNGLPGDSGKIEITECKKKFARGKMLTFDVISNGRQEASCPYYGDCGGCDLQHQKYAHQLVFKEHKVRNALHRIGGFKNICIDSIVFNNDYYYRNKVTLRVNGPKIGFYKRNTNEIVDISHCLISNKSINNVISILNSFIKKHSDNDIESIMVRSCDGIMISITSESDILAPQLKIYLESEIDSLKSIILNGKVISGKNYIDGSINEFTYKLSSKSFYQVNNDIMNKMYSKVVEHISKTDNQTILDLYCGVGTITLLLSKYAKRVIGIEAVKEAITDAKENAIINNISNVIFIEGKVENEILSILEEEIDTIVVDPPRNGIDKKAIESIIQINPKQIIYISCDPATLARDLKILCNAEYEIKRVTPFDMFPQTSHVETVCRLIRK